MKKTLLKLSVAAALTLGFAVLTPVAAQAQTSSKSTVTNPPGVPEGYVVVGGSGTPADPFVYGEEGTDNIGQPTSWSDPDDGYTHHHIWYAPNGQTYYYLWI